MAEKRVTCTKVSTLVGCLLVCLPNGVMAYWGNMAVYVLSYMKRSGVIGTEVISPWIFSAFLISWSLSLIVARSVAKLLGRRLTMVVGMVLVDGGLALSYLSIGHSLTLLDLTHGLMVGLGHGLTYAMVLTYVIVNSDNHVAFFTAAVSTSVNVGGAIITQVVSFYLNPDDRTPDLHLGPSTFFTDLDILEKVPSVYLVLAAVAVSAHVLGFLLLIRDPGREKTESGDERVKEEWEDDVDKTSLCNGRPVARYAEEKDARQCGPVENVEENYTKYGAVLHRESRNDGEYQTHQIAINIQEETSACHSHATGDRYTETTSSNAMATFPSDGLDKFEEGKEGEARNPAEESKIFQNNGNVQHNVESVYNTNGSTSSVLQEHRNVDNNKSLASLGDGKESEEEGVSLSPRQVLLSPTFYVLWLLLFIVDFGYLTQGNYYKTFGELFVRSDQTLADLGSAIAIVTAVSRLAGGWLLDRISLRLNMILFYSVLSVGYAFYYFTPMLSTALFLVWTVMLSAGDSAVFMSFAVSTLRLFGPKYFTTNYGLVMVATIVLNLVAPPFFQAVLQHLGWFTLYLSNAVLSTLGLILALVALPNAYNKIPI